ncbi:MAG: hypothetical protein DMF64_20860 [Acidobacteria bacterium]|nr:MAG: hypothetical protein DMF64_20860 [Acidobacteriota bacterium]
MMKRLQSMKRRLRRDEMCGEAMTKIGNKLARWFALIACVSLSVGAQVSRAQSVSELPEQQKPAPTRSSVANYFDPANGLTADDAVARALAENGELAALRQEVEAARALVAQASARANPKLDVRGAQQIGGTDNSVMIEGMLPLELGGRRAARVAVAERELEMRELALADRERVLAAEVREKFGAALAEILKLGFNEELLLNSQRGYKLVMARVLEGRTPPLEQNMALVEVNRLRSMRETQEGKVEVALLELRNLIGMQPDEPVKLRGDFSNLIDGVPPVAELTTQALRERADLKVARAAEALAAARIEAARIAGRPDAEVRAGYQLMRNSFPVNGINDAGALQPVASTFNFLTFGVTLDLPVRNKNQGALAAATADAEAAQRRREFAELTAKREVAAAYARYERAGRAMEIYRVGVRAQAEQNLTVVKQTYELGARTLLDYITEQRRYVELEGDYINALLETYQARVEIERAAAAPELIKR